MNPSHEPAPPTYEEQPAYPYGPPEAVVWDQPAARPARRSLRRSFTVGGLILASMAVAGAPIGLLWTWLSPSVPVINAGQNGSRTTIFRLGAVRVAPTPALRADLKMILGPSAVL